MAFHRVNKDCLAPQDKTVHLVLWLVCIISLSQYLPMQLDLESLGGVFFYFWQSETGSSLLLPVFKSDYSRPTLSLYWTYTDDIQVNSIICFWICICISPESFTHKSYSICNTLMLSFAVFFCFSLCITDDFAVSCLVLSHFDSSCCLICVSLSLLPHLLLLLFLSFFVFCLQNWICTFCYCCLGPSWSSWSQRWPWV